MPAKRLIRGVPSTYKPVKGFTISNDNTKQHDSLQARELPARFESLHVLPSLAWLLLGLTVFRRLLSGDLRLGGFVGDLQRSEYAVVSDNDNTSGIASCVTTDQYQKELSNVPRREVYSKQQLRCRFKCVVGAPGR